MNLENNGKINFLIGIYTPFSRALTGGIVAMHKLAYELADRGHNVYIFCEPEYPHPNIKVIPTTLNKEEEFLEWYKKTGRVLGKVLSIEETSLYRSFCIPVSFLIMLLRPQGKTPRYFFPV